MLETEHCMNVRIVVKRSRRFWTCPAAIRPTSRTVRCVVGRLFHAAGDGEEWMLDVFSENE
jgi:hypothetical protein